MCYISICDTCNLVKAFNSCLLHALSIGAFFVHPHVYTHSLCVHPTPSVYTPVPLSTLQSLCLHPTLSVYTPLPLSTPHSFCLHPTPSVYTPLPLSTPHSLCLHSTPSVCILLAYHVHQLALAVVPSNSSSIHICNTLTVPFYLLW